MLLTNIVNGSSNTKCVSLSNQKCMIQPTLINLHCNKDNQEFHYYPFSGKLDLIFYLSNKVSVPNKTEDLDLSVF